MSNIVQDFIENYIRDTIQPSEGIMKEMEEYARENNVPIVHREVAKLLEVLIMGCRIKKILEIGTAIGYSAIIMAKAAGEEGRVITIEIDENMEEKAKSFIKSAGMENRIRVIGGDARKILKELEGSFNLVFIDGAKGHYEEMFNSAMRLLEPGGIIVCDNVLFRGMVASNRLVKRRKITIVKRMRKFLDLITKHSQLNTAIIPIGDGLSISYRREVQDEKDRAAGAGGKP
jgi:predicted O-methyltransferase YrrM